MGLFPLYSLRTVSSLHFSPSTTNTDDEPPRWLLSGSDDKTLKVWNVSDVDQVDQCSLSCSAFHAVSTSPDELGNFLIATVNSDNRIQVLLIWIFQIIFMIIIPPFIYSVCNINCWILGREWIDL